VGGSAVQDAKKALRAQLRAAIRTLPDKERDESDGAIFQYLIALPEYRAAGTVFAYCSVEHEISTRGLLRHALDAGKRVALPAVLGGGEMVFRALQGELVTGSFYGIPEPQADAAELLPEKGDLVLVPALCYDRAGYRLGQGGGYYDRFLARYPAVFSVGLGRACLLQERLPREAHDRPVDCLVTEKGAARPR